MMTLSQMADRFEKLLGRLPGPIRTPVEREWQPLKELFLHRRAPRLLLVGSDAEVVLRQLLPGDAEIEQNSRWHTAHRRGVVHFILARKTGKAARTAIAEAAPDCLILTSGETADLELLRELHRLDLERYGQAVPIIATGAEPTALAGILYDDSALAPAVAAILPGDDREAVLAAIARALPVEARLEFARVTGEKAVQREIARTLTRSTAAVCTAIGAQPIPLADLPILTSLQGLMVAGIIYASGREWSFATVRDFLGAMGVNVGAAFLLREGTRAAVKLLPGWGNAVSGAVAGAGTYAIGLAATGYFVDGLPVDEVRRRFRLGRKKKAESGS